MLAVVRPVRSLLAAIFILMAGSGFLSTLIGLRLERAGNATLVIGLVATAYFAGLTVGALRAGRIVCRVGHIRAFAAFVALLSASTLTYGLIQHPSLWAALRLVDGFCVAGVFICIESWLGDRAGSETRGSILAAYMIALYSGQALGQMLLSTGEIGPAIPFQLASILITLAILPICLTHGTAPAPGEGRSLSFGRLFEASPLGAAGAAFTGLILGGFYGLAAIFARRVGLDLAATANFMATVILGGVALQWPLGRLSDRLDRRRVIIASFAATALVSFVLAAEPTGAMLLASAAAFGGLSFALYPLCVAHVNDRLLATERVSASGQLVLLYSGGAVLGPLLAAGFMGAAGAGGLFLFSAACAALMLIFSVWRLLAAAPVPAAAQGEFQTFPRTTPMAGLLDPKVEEPELAGATIPSSTGER